MRSNVTRRMTRFISLFSLSILLGLCLPWMATSQVQTTYHQQIHTFTQQLAMAKQQNTVYQNQLARFEAYQNDQIGQLEAKEITQAMLERNQLDLAVAQADLLNAKQIQKDANLTMSQFTQEIKALEVHLQKLRIAMLDKKQDLQTEIDAQNAEIEYKKSLYAIAQQWFDVLKKNSQLTEKIVHSLEEWQSYLNNLYHEHQNVLREKALEQLEHQANQEQQQWLAKLDEYGKQLQTIDREGVNADHQLIQLRTQILQTEEKIKLSQYQLRLTGLNDQVQDLNLFTSKQLLISTIPELDQALGQIELIKTELLDRKESMEGRTELIRNNLIIQELSYQQGIISRSEYQKNQRLLQSLLTQYEQQIYLSQEYKEQAQQYEKKIDAKLREALSIRHGLRLLDGEAWKILGAKLWHIPKTTINLVQSLKDHVVLAIKQMTQWQRVLLIIVEFLWLLIWWFARQYSQSLLAIVAKKRERMSGNIVFIGLQLIRRNLLGLILLGALISLLIFAEISFSSYAVLLYLAMVWFIFRIVIGIARLTLVETMSDVSGHDVRLYHRLKWAFVLGGVVTGLTVYAHQMNVAYEVQDIFNRLFMLFLLLVSLILLRWRKVLPSLLSAYIEKQRPYVRKLIQLLCILVPVILLSNAIIGLLGYFDLAWQVSNFQMFFLLVLTGYIVLRGLVIDLMDIISEKVIANAQNGWLWSEAFLKPISTFLRLVVFIIAAVSLILLYGWNQDLPILHQVGKILTAPLFTFLGREINFVLIIELLTLLILIFWAARWIREFAYRWAFSNIKDPALRNSAAVFTQYAFVAVGILTVLWVSKIDFTGLTVVLGALSFGIGFGLRDFANNFVSGTLLLIERPLRVGDFISVGTYEGEVTHIGMRSLIIKTWDHMEVVVPNADIFSKAFVNWTHQDSIVRTVIPVKIHRDDEPHKVQNIILDVLNRMLPVLKKPEPQVFLQHISESLIEFDVRYFINLTEHSRFEVRSDVLFAIADAFKRHQIRPPYPQYDLHVNSRS